MNKCPCGKNKLNSSKDDYKYCIKIGSDIVFAVCQHDVVVINTKNINHTLAKDYYFEQIGAYGN